MIKATIFAFLLVQLCILQAHASHYIQFKLRKVDAPIERVGICMHDGSRVFMWDWDKFSSTVKNYGFHKDGISANVNWDHKDIGVSTWSWTSKFPMIYDDKSLYVWEGCWSTTAAQCRDFESTARELCDNILDNWI